jgi:hypothetical protein
MQATQGRSAANSTTASQISPQGPQANLRDGYTVEVVADSGQGIGLNLMIRPGTDLDDCFKAWDLDEQEFIRVNGWLFTFSTVED